MLGSNTVSADDSVVDEVTVNVPVSCTMTGTGMNSHTAEINNGTYQANIGTTTLKAYCNDSNGFSIYAIGFTGDQYTGEDHTKLIGANTNQKIATGTATSAGNPDISNWAMKLTAVSSPTPTYPITLDNGYGSYSAVPSTYAKVAHRDSGTDVGTNAEGSTLTTTYAAYISRTQVADTYEGKVKYTLVHPVNETPVQQQVTPSGYIGYYPNTSMAVGSMSDVNGGPVQELSLARDWSGCYYTDYKTYCNDENWNEIDESTLPDLGYYTDTTLLASNYSRAGYGFAGWTDAYDYETNPNAHFYGPNEDISFTVGQYISPNDGLSLYAVWIPSAGSLQDSAKVSELCGTGQGSLVRASASGAVTLESVSALTDQRDNQTYAIAKLADGNCWMIENLRLDSESTLGNNYESLAQGYGKYSGSGTDYGNFVGLADSEDDHFFNSTVANNLYSTNGSYDTIQIGNSDYPSRRMPRYNHINTYSDPDDGTRATSLVASTSYLTVAGANIYSYGNYYTWPAAIANTNSYGPEIVDIEGRTPSEAANTSLCPTGWRLPYGRNVGKGIASGGFYNLGTELNAVTNDAASSRIWRKFPTNFLYSGNYYYNSVNDRGRDGRYWSSTAVDNSYNSSYDFTMVEDSYLRPGDVGDYKYMGIPVRCVVAP